MKKSLIILSLFAFLAISNSAKAQTYYILGTDVTGCQHTILLKDASNITLGTPLVVIGGTSNASPAPPGCSSVVGLDHIEVQGPGSCIMTFGSGGVFTNQTLGPCCGLNNIVLTVNAPSCGTGTLNLQFNFN